MGGGIKCFKAYDIRGRVPDELNEDIAYRIGRAYAEYLQPARVVVGHDIRLTSEMISDALIEGLIDSGVHVFHIGECGTEEVYFSTSHFKMDGGIVVTASHNPKDYNGMKLVRQESRPISGDTGLNDIEGLVEANTFSSSIQKGRCEFIKHRPEYISHLLGYVDVDELKALNIVANAGNGGAGAVIDALEERLPFNFIKVHHQADGNFPNGVPNPLLPENRRSTIEAIKKHQADLGVAWDGDFDRCFFFDEQGNFIEGYYIVGLLAEVFLDQFEGAKVVHDPRLTWNTIDIVSEKLGLAVQSKTGHAFIKERMRQEDAVYGGEMSAHHYFRDFSYCDSGMIPWLLVASLISRKKQKLSDLIKERIELFPVSGEINRRIQNPAAILKKVESRYETSAKKKDFTDGLSMEFENWRFNLRMSNTEPVVRLNVESRADMALMEEKTQAILNLMGGEAL